jgi:hypothetical protein
MSAVNYRLELPTQWSIHPVFHIDLLTPYRETITHGANYQRPPPDLVDNEEEYEVETILDSRLFGRRKRLQYLVKWAGYPDSDNMWVDKDDVFAEDKVREFKRRNPAAKTHIRGDQASPELEQGAVTGSEAALGATPATPNRRRTYSNGSATDHDLRRCARCGEQNQYCHGHTPIIPNASLDLPPRLPVRATIQPNGVARINLNRAQATALASRLIDALEVNQDAAPVPPAYTDADEFARIVAESLGITPAVAAEGLGLRTRGGRGQGRGRGNGPRPVPDARRPANAQQAQGPRAPRRVASPVPAGFEHNRGPAFIPFRIRNEHGGETPARYIRAHLDAPNPFVEGRLSLNGPTYHSEIHAAAVHDVDIPPPPITADILRLLHTDYMGHDRVDEALGELGDRSLIAEVARYRRLERKRKAFQDSITRIEDQLFTCDIERRMCVSRLESARAMVRIQGEMQRNQQAFRLSPWSAERGRLP